MTYIAFLLLLLLLVFITTQVSAHTQPVNAATLCHWELLTRNLGISAMHMQLFPDDQLLAYDRTTAGPSNISLPCIPHKESRPDCTAHSVMFDPIDLNVRPLALQTDTWCSCGALLPNGTLIQTGGYNSGERVVRYLTSCENCSWVEDYTNRLATRRWYASSQILPDGRVIVVGGRRSFTYEFVPKVSPSDFTSYYFHFLRETLDPSSENNLYPFLHLAPDGNLFVFANTRAILFDYANNKVLKYFPELPGGISRSYPSTGSSVLLPIRVGGNSPGSGVKAEVLICGGAESSSFTKVRYNGTYLAASDSCGRLEITAESPVWVMEEMPLRRVMGDMILLPTGDVLIINGAANGTAGWGNAREPVLFPVLYQTGIAIIPNGNQTFQVLKPSGIPRMYHSTAHLLSDGRVIVGGSNPQPTYEFRNVMFPTELSVEAFSPPYLVDHLEGLGGWTRPSITAVEPGDSFDYGVKLGIGFELIGVSCVDFMKNGVNVTMVAPSFTTHSFSMNQRLLVLEVEALWVGREGFKVDVFSPVSANVAPPGYYMMFVLHKGVPSRGKWIHIGKW